VITEGTREFFRSSCPKGPAPKGRRPLSWSRYSMPLQPRVLVLEICQTGAAISKSITFKSPYHFPIGFIANVNRKSEGLAR
jgi:hypothetical protein